tara:strand:- start:5429 stop:6949 length:1521 start_codon:yes stop_codon:yes gene_type:complete
MSEIDDLGKRLVKDSQDRRDKMRRRQERYEKKTAIASLVLPIGAKIIEDRLTQKAQDFFNQEEVLNLKRQHTKANREASSIFSLRDAISQSSKTDEEYFYDQVYGTVESETLSAANARQQDEGINIVGRHVQSGDMLNQELIGTIKKNATDLSVSRAAEYRESLAAADKIVSSEQFDSMMAGKLRNTTPQTILGAAGRLITSTFGGTSTAERQNIAIADIRSHHFSEDSKALGVFNEKYEETKNIRDALDYANIVKEIEEYVPRVIETIPGMQIVRASDGSQVALRTTQRINEDGTKGDMTFVGGAENIPGVNKGLSIAEKETELRSARSNFNIIAIGSRLVGSDVFMKDFVDNLTVKKANSDFILRPSNVETIEEYNIMLNTWNSWISKDENLAKIQSDEQRAEAREIRRLGVQLAMDSDDMIELRNILSDEGLGDYIDTPEYKQIFDHYVDVKQGTVEAGYGVDAAALLKFSSIAESHLEYLIKYDAFKNFAGDAFLSFGQNGL